MDRFVDERLRKITEELSSSEEKRLHARIEIDNRDELLKETASLVRRLLNGRKCECSPPCQIKGLSWSTCDQYRDCLKSNECLPCLHCEAKHVLAKIEEVSNHFGNWFDDPLIKILQKNIHSSFEDE
jgi:hypothetical protein